MKKIIIILSIVILFLSVESLSAQSKNINDDLYSTEKRLSKKERIALREAEKLRIENAQKASSQQQKIHEERMRQDVVANDAHVSDEEEQQYYSGMYADMLNNTVSDSYAQNDEQPAQSSQQPSWSETNNITFSFGVYVPSYYGWNSWYANPYYSPFYFGYSNYWAPMYNPWYSPWYSSGWYGPHYNPHYGHYPHSYSDYGGRPVVRDSGRRSTSYANRMVTSSGGRTTSTRATASRGTRSNSTAVRSNNTNTRSTSTAIRSNNTNTRSNSTAVRSNNTNTRSNSTAVRSSNTNTRSTSTATRSTSTATRSSGTTRSTGTTTRRR